MESWGNFFFAQVGASATLAGLIFVGVSLNLPRVPQHRGLPDLALESLLLLGLVLIVSTLALVSDQGVFIFGVELLVVGALAWIGLILVQWRSWKRTTPIYRSSFALRIPLVQIATLASSRELAS